MVVLNGIITWSIDKPLWWRDALRRLVLKDRLEEEDIDELVLICRASQGITDPNNPAPHPNPLIADQLPVPGDSVEDVVDSDYWGHPDILFPAASLNKCSGHKV